MSVTRRSSHRPILARASDIEDSLSDRPRLNSMFSLCSLYGLFASLGVGDVVSMGAEAFPVTIFHRLAPPGDASGVSCDENGPATRRSAANILDRAERLATRFAPVSMAPTSGTGGAQEQVQCGKSGYSGETDFDGKKSRSSGNPRPY